MLSNCRRIESLNDTIEIVVKTQYTVDPVPLRDRDGRRVGETQFLIVALLEGCDGSGENGRRHVEELEYGGIQLSYCRYRNRVKGSRCSPEGVDQQYSTADHHGALKTTPSRLRNHAQRRKVRPVKSGIETDQRVRVRDCVAADEEVRSDVLSWREGLFTTLTLN